MKNNFIPNLIILTILLMHSLYAEDKKVLTSNEYILAKVQYKIGNYQDSYKKFYTLFLKYTNNVEINYYLAMSAQKLKQYDEATAAFERVLIVKPEFHRARLEYARVLFLVGFKKQAKDEFLKVAASPIPQNVRKSIDKYLKQIDKKDKVNSTFISLNFGLGYDNNINSGLDDETYTLPGFSNFEVTGEEPESSTAHVTSFQLNHIHSIGNNTPYILKHTGFIYNKNQTKDDSRNFQFFSYKPTIYYNDPLNKSEYSIQLGIERVLPGDDTDFLTYSINPTLKKLLNKNTIFKTFGKYQEIHYMDSLDKDKDYTKQGLGFSLKYKKFKYKLNFEKDEKIRGSRNDVDKDIIEHTISYSNDIQPKLILFLQYKYKQIEYVDTNSSFANIRDDINKNIYVGLTKIINKKDFLTLSYSDTNNNSNQAAYTYDKNTVNLNYTWRFKF